MYLLRIAWRILLLTLLLLFPSTALLAQEFGESVTRSGTVKDDIYLAGSSVNLDVIAEGDVIAAGEILLKRLRRQTELTRGWRVAALVIMLVVVGVLGAGAGIGRPAHIRAVAFRARRPVMAGLSRHRGEMST